VNYEPRKGWDDYDPTVGGEARSRRTTGLAAAKGISARALMAKQFDPIKYVVPGYIVEGLTIFAGAPKLGKSWACLGMAVAVASGGVAFGSIRCDEGDVLYLALEDNERRLQDRLRQMRISDLPERLTLITDWPDLDGACIDELETWLINTPGARLIAIDVLAKVRGTDGNKEGRYDADYRFAAKLQNLASKYCVGIVAVHHTRKMVADDPFDEVSGTRGTTGAADSILVLKRDQVSKRATLYGRGRDLPEIETAMEFDHQYGTWKILGDASQVAKTEERQEILEVLGRSVDPMSPTEIATMLGKSRSNINHMLTRLYKERKVEKVSAGKYALVSPIHTVHSPHSHSERGEWSELDTQGKHPAGNPALGRVRAEPVGFPDEDDDPAVSDFQRG
jgi:hypothetical protein